MKTLALIHIQFGPYHFARANALAQVFLGNIQLIQLASHEDQREWAISDKQELITLVKGTLDHLNPKQVTQQLIRCLEELNPDAVIIPGYGHAAMRAAAEWAKRNGVATIMLSDSQWIDQPRNFFKEWFKAQWLQHHFDIAFVAGASAASYLRQLGFSPHKIWRGYDVVDNHYFATQALKARQESNYLRVHLNLPEQYFLYVGRFSPEKNLIRLLQAYKTYYQQSSYPWSLVLVGSGPQSALLKAQVTQSEINGVIWREFQQIDQLPNYYALASTLILPSVSEPWGLVVNEAMACSLPILISSQCGSFYDLVFPGVNGYVFDPLDSQSITNAMLRMEQKPLNKRQNMGNASAQIVSSYSLSNWAIALNDCIEFSIHSNSK